MPTSMTICNAGLNLLRDSLKGSGSPVVKYVAFGSGTATPAATDTKLANETYRKAVTGYASGATSGEIVVSAYLGPGELVGGNIQEIGFFISASATTTANSGVLLARCLYVLNPKPVGQSLPITFDFSL